MVAAGVDSREARLRAVCSLILSAWPLLRPLVSLATQLDADDRRAVDDAVVQARAWIGTAT